MKFSVSYIDKAQFSDEGLDWETISQILINWSVAEARGESSLYIRNDPEDVESKLSEDLGSDFPKVMAVLKRLKLLQAAYHSNLDKLTQLIAAGVDINARNPNKYTALSIATNRGDEKVVSLLVQHGAQVNTYSTENTTPLMLAAKGGYLNIIKVLLQSGADTTAKNNNGWTASMYASLAGKEDASLLIREKMHIDNGPKHLSVEDVQKANNLFASLERYVQTGEHRLLKNAILELENLLGRNDQIMLLHAQAFLAAGELKTAACVALDIIPENTDADFVLKLKTMIAMPLAAQAISQLNRTLKPIVSAPGACSDYYYGQRLQRKEAAREPLIMLSLAHKLAPERDDITAVYNQVKSI